MAGTAVSALCGCVVSVARAVVELGPERVPEPGEFAGPDAGSNAGFPECQHPRAAYNSVACTQLLEVEPEPRAEASDSCLHGTSPSTLCSSRARN